MFYILGVANGPRRVCLEELYFLFMAEYIVARGWSSALVETTNLVQL